MFLEQQIEQLTQRVTMHDQQIEILSKGLADLTIDVRSVRDDMNGGFQRIDRRFDALEGRFDTLEKEQASMQEKLSLIVKLLTDRV